jgi:hypothetical protein
MLMEAALPGLGVKRLYDADKYPRMCYLRSLKLRTDLPKSLITGGEKVFVWHFMRQQAYNPAADVPDGYADGFRHPGRCGPALQKHANGRVCLRCAPRV